MSEWTPNSDYAITDPAEQADVTVGPMPHPGGFIRSAVLEPLGLTISDAARKMDVDRPTLSRVIGGQHALSDDLALKLEALTGVSAELMIAMQHRHAWPAKRAQYAATIERVAA